MSRCNGFQLEKLYQVSLVYNGGNLKKTNYDCRNPQNV